jgi:hypothetical protein
VSILVDSIAYTKTLIDTSYSLYGIINSYFVKKHNLKLIKLETPQPITGYEGREELDVTGRKDSPFKRAEEVVTKLKEVQEIA